MLRDKNFLQNSLFPIGGKEKGPFIVKRVTKISKTYTTLHLIRDPPQLHQRTTGTDREPRSSHPSGHPDLLCYGVSRSQRDYP